MSPGLTGETANLETVGVSYCHWKGNALLDRAAVHETSARVSAGVEDDEMIERALSGGAAALVRKSIAPAEPNSAAAEPFAGPTGSRSTTAATISAAASGSIRMKAAWCPSLFRRGSSGIRPRYT